MVQVEPPGVGQHVPQDAVPERLAGRRPVVGHHHVERQAFGMPAQRVRADPGHGVDLRERRTDGPFGENGVDLQAALGGDAHRQSDGAHHGAGTLGGLGDDQRPRMRSGPLGKDDLRAADIHVTGGRDRLGRGARGDERRGRHHERRQSHRPAAPYARRGS